MCHGDESTWKDPRPEGKKMPKGEKNTFIYVYVRFLTTIIAPCACSAFNMPDIPYVDGLSHVAF